MPRYGDLHNYTEFGSEHFRELKSKSKELANI